MLEKVHQSILLVQILFDLAREASVIDRFVERERPSAVLFTCRGSVLLVAGNRPVSLRLCSIH